VKPVLPFLFEISKDSRDHSPEVYQEVIMPGFRTGCASSNPQWLFRTVP